MPLDGTVETSRRDALGVEKGLAPLADYIGPRKIMLRWIFPYSDRLFVSDDPRNARVLVFEEKHQVMAGVVSCSTACISSDGQSEGHRHSSPTYAK